MFEFLGCIGIDCMDIVLSYYHPLHGDASNNKETTSYYYNLRPGTIAGNPSLYTFRKDHAYIVKLWNNCDNAHKHIIEKYIMNINEVKLFNVPFDAIVKMSSIVFGVTLYDMWYLSASGWPLGAFGDSCTCRSLPESFDITLEQIRIMQFVCSNLGHTCCGRYDDVILENTMVFDTMEEYITADLGRDVIRFIGDVKGCHDHLLKVNNVNRIGRCYISKLSIEKIRKHNESLNLEYNSSWTSEFSWVGLINSD